MSEFGPNDFEKLLLQNTGNTVFIVVQKDTGAVIGVYEDRPHSLMFDMDCTIQEAPFIKSNRHQKPPVYHYSFQHLDKPKLDDDKLCMPFYESGFEHPDRNTYTKKL